MRCFSLRVNATLEFVQKLELKDGNDASYEFVMVCEKCHNRGSLRCSLNSYNSVKCKLCTRPRQKWKVRVVKTAGAALGREDAGRGAFVTFLKLHCFGATPETFTFGAGWKITMTEDLVVVDADLSTAWVRNINGHAAVVGNLQSTLTEHVDV